MQWFLTTPGGQEYEVDCSSWSLNSYYETGTPRPNEAKLTIPRRIPALEKQWVRGEEDGETKFLGFVSRKPSLSAGNQDLECRGVEALLWHRPCPKLTYSASDTTLNHLFASDPPWIAPDDVATYEIPGLLNSANSLMVPGWIASEFMTPIPASIEPGIVYGPRWYPTYAQDIIKFRFCGKKSCFGNTPIYHDWHIFPEVNTLAELEASTDPAIYRDDIDLYMCVPLDPVPGIYSTGFGYVYGNFFALNAFDTRVRRGTIDLADTLITDPITIGPDSQIGDIIANIATIHEQKIRFRYIKIDGAYYCYLDVREDFDDEGTLDIYESECSKIEFGTDSDLHPDGLIGLGYGERLFKAAYSIFDPRPGRAFIVDTIDFDNSFEDYSGNLAPYVSLKWDELRAKNIVKITTDAYNYATPGNNIKLHIDGEADTTYQVASIERSHNSPAVISVGKRTKDIIDAVRARQDASSTYLIDDLSEIGSASFSGVIGVGDWANAAVPFLTNPLYLPKKSSYEKYNPAVLLDISISLRQNCFVPTDISSLFYIEKSTDGETFTRIRNSETIQYMIGESMMVNVMGDVQWNSKNYFRVNCLLNGMWPAYDRTLADIILGINTPADGISRNADAYRRGVWGRYSNKDYYALLVLLESDYYAYQIQAPGELNVNAAWALGNGDKVAKALYYSFKTAAGRSGNDVLNDIVTPLATMDRPYMRGVWGRTYDSGYYMLMIKLESGDKYAYQIQPPGTWVPENSWSVGTKAEAAAALYASSQDGPRSASDIETDITNTDFPALDYSYQVHGYDTGTYPIATIIELSANPVEATDPIRLAYRIETASGTYTEWKVDESSGDDICNALLSNFTLDDLRKQSDIRTDISNLEFDNPDTYSWQAYGYEPPATPSMTIIQVSNAPQVLAYKRKWVDDEEGDWAIDTSSGADIATQLMPPVRYYDISVNASVVRRRTVP